MSTYSVSSPFGLFSCSDTFLHGLAFCEVADIGRSMTVCRLWNNTITDIWGILFERKGLPPISRNGQICYDKVAFKIMYKSTLVSGEMIGKLFGKMGGKIPPIGEKFVDRLEDPDPFEPEKLIRDNYGFVVTPHWITRTVDEKTPLALDECGNLLELSEEELYNLRETHSAEKEILKIPFSLKNHKILCSYPLQTNNNMPVFNRDSSSQVFNQCDTRPDKIGVYFMRKHIAEKTRGMSYNDQKNLVQAEGFEITPLRERLILDSSEILILGTCPDNREPLVYARNPDTIRAVGGHVFQSIIGSYAPCVGVRVESHDFVPRSFFGSNHIGVVPGCSAEVPWPSTAKLDPEWSI